MTGGMGIRACRAERQSEAGDVRFGSKADIRTCGRQSKRALEHRVVVGGFFGDRLDDIPMFDDLGVFQLVNIHDGVAA